MTGSATLRAWQATTLVVALVAVVVLAFAVDGVARSARPGLEGGLGYAAKAARVGDRAAHVLISLAPDSPLRAAGLAPGDLILDPPRELLRRGDVLHLEVVRGGTPTVVDVRVAPASSLAFPGQIAMDGAVAALALVLGLAIAVRRWHDRGALAIAIMFFLWVGGVAPAPADHGAAGWAALWSMCCAVAAMPLLCAYALQLEGRGPRVLLRWVRAVAVLLAGGGAAWLLAYGPYWLGRAPHAPEAWLMPSLAALMGLGAAVAALAFIDRWRCAEGEVRERLRWMLAALGLVLVNFVLMASWFAGALRNTFVFQLATDALSATALIVLAYAIIRHRVVDLGFVVNRAVVFATFTAVLLVGFAVVEWLVDHVITFEQREQNAWLDAFVAVGIYLVFHRARHSIESGVERVFFREWHAKEERLARFLETTSHYGGRDALLAATLAAVDDFTGAAGSAIYAADPGDALALVAATAEGVPAALGRDAAAVVELRALQRPCALEGRAAVPGAVHAFPMLRRAELVGALLVGPKAGGALRPDEVAHLARLARQVGADLHALRVDELERARRDVALENEALRRALGRGAGMATADAAVE